MSILVGHFVSSLRQKSKWTEEFTKKRDERERFLLCWGLTTRQPLRVILCRLPEKGRKEVEESRGDEREGQGRKRNRNESEETEEIKTFPLYPYPLQG